ncbi:hypothetical protein J0683_25365, partial [Vibrio parahaemolyticus]|uniref:hypothetical protein n=1 Tax=Vibrio parahaemolyticus TaxID=670 RepID=UPI001A909976|nr:hypothetical protein [Vibrio parahaemolyticus]
QKTRKSENEFPKDNSDYARKVCPGSPGRELKGIKTAQRIFNNQRISENQKSMDASRDKGKYESFAKNNGVEPK